MANRISAESADAVAALFRAEARELFGYACTLPNVSRSDADDLVQVTFQAAAMEWEQKLCGLDHEARRKWLYRVMHYKAIDQWRGDKSRWRYSQQADSAARSAQETDHSALCSVALERCWDKIRRMPEARQRVAFLKWGEEWSSAEIAELMGITESTVRVQLKLARDELKAAIGPQVPFIDSGDDTDDGWA
jgi:RNA polymerase sigma-70 factor (ECF subfamily)